MQVKETLNTRELLARFPNGFAVTPTGRIYEIVYLTQDDRELSNIYPASRVRSEQSGYLVVRPPLTQEGDQRFLQQVISVQDFYKHYDKMTFREIEEAEKVAEFLNERGVGLDNRHFVSVFQEEDQFKLTLSGGVVEGKVISGTLHSDS